MYELLFQLSVGFAVALSGALIPGPLLAFITMKTLDSGPRTGTLAASGHILVELGILSLVAFGLGSVLRSHLFTLSIGGLGGVALIGMGALTLKKSARPPSASGEAPTGGHHPVVGGILFSTVFNPSVGLWWMTVGLATLMAAIGEAGALGGVFWIAGHFSADIAWFSAVSFSVDRGRELIGGKFYRGLLVACGTTLLVFGFYFSITYLPELIL